MHISICEKGKFGKSITIDEFCTQNLLKLHDSNQNYVEFEVKLGENATTREILGAVRLCAFRIPDEIAQRKYNQAIKDAKREGRILSKAKKVLCFWHICYTNLPKEECCTKDVIEIYRKRWQIELRFKVWKSRLGLGGQVLKQKNIV